jgi:hypothetical protein
MARGSIAEELLPADCPQPHTQNLKEKIRPCPPAGGIGGTRPGLSSPKATFALSGAFGIGEALTESHRSLFLWRSGLLIREAHLLLASLVEQKR